MLVGISQKSGKGILVCKFAGRDHRVTEDHSSRTQLFGSKSGFSANKLFPIKKAVGSCKMSSGRTAGNYNAVTQHIPALGIFLNNRKCQGGFL